MDQGLRSNTPEAQQPQQCEGIFSMKDIPYKNSCLKGFLRVFSTEITV